MKIGDIVVSVGIIFMILMIIIPMPEFLVDIMLSMNISLSLLILLIAMFNREVNFMVITKGSERVSEVAARFTLDAMPGKQMAIDADLNSGMIDETQARTRRSKIQREADFYGSMDGATKFVKGDSIAGIIITFINLLGGILMGILYLNISAGEALQKYALLAVGDGLVSSIPSLLISAATGIIVTRSASEDNLGNDLRNQLFNNSTIMFIVSGVLFFLALTPLPTLPYLVLSIVFLFVGNSIRVKDGGAEKADVKEEQDVKEDVEEIRRPENVLPLLNVEAIELEFGYGIIPLADKSQGGDLFDRLVMIRRQCALELGIIVPMIRLRDNIQLQPNEYIIKIKGVEVANGSVLFDHYLAMNPGNADGELSGIDTIEPSFGLPAKWIDSKEREKAEIYGYTVVDPPSIIATHLTEIIKRYAHELIGRQDVKMLIDNLKETQPSLVDEVTPALLSLGEIQKVLANLLRESVSIRNFSTIVESLADYAQVTKDTDMLTEYVRQSMYRNITNQFMPQKEAKVITMDQDVEKSIMESLQTTETGTYMALDPVRSKRLLNNINEQVEKAISLGEQPIIVTAPIVRFYLKKFIEQLSSDIIVLSYNEIDPTAKIQSIGMVSA